MKELLKKFWKLFWKDESLLGYIVFLVVTYLVLKFVIMPLFMYVFGIADITGIVTESMVHYDETNYRGWLIEHNLSDENWPFKNGIYPGDAVVVKKCSFDDIHVGDVISYNAPIGIKIVHRVVYKGDSYVVTKGDANPEPLYFEYNVTPDMINGKAVYRIPYIAYPRIMITRLFGV